MGEVVAMGVLRPDPSPGVLWPRIRARRCLFGPPDPVETQSYLEKETKNIEENNSKRWNFDFVQEKPLDSGGQFAWTEVKKEEQTLITDFMRKRKSSTLLEDPPDSLKRKRRRNST